MLDISDTTPLKDLKRGAAGVIDDLPELLSLQINSSPAVPVQDMSTASVPLEPATAADAPSSMEALNHV